ncbi:hypothetical protein PENSUB_12673 [Penicillium subrubescens]|uniref:Uncharacterized protein n=1 Tax=Penicillium subrubescens TaxID=1316194 RepID=A0A1Q5SXE2_9EURO|nr:hypothetical protein PENSUB_12673 [Penicillium subrubescens]
MIEASPECKYFGPDIKFTIQASCGPLLEMCEDGVIQIIHHSLTEFILNFNVEHIGMNQKSRDFAIVDSQAVHRKIARTCINYLTSGCFKTWQFAEFRDHEPEERQSLFLQFYFLRYAILEWPFHVAKAGDDRELLDKLGEFCRDGNHHYEAWNDIWRACQGEDVPRHCSALHVSAYTGLYTLTQYLLSQGSDPDSKDEDGRTPIVYAIMKGRHEIVSLLLRNNASHDVKVETYLHPTKINSLIHYACKLKHVQALCALLDGGMSPVVKDDGLSTSGKYY